MNKSIGLIFIFCSFLLASCSKQGQKVEDTQKEGAENKAVSEEKDSSKTALEGSITISGSTTVFPVAEALIEEFKFNNHNVNISYESVGSSAGIKALLNNEVIAAGASRELTKEEIDKGASEIKIAKDALVVIANSSSGITSITKENLAKVFSGEVKNFSEIGGNNAPILVVNREESSGSRGAFQELVLSKTPFTDKADIRASAGEVAIAISTTPNSIGYVGLAQLPEAQSSGAVLVNVDDVTPTEENVKNGSYALSRPLSFIVRKDSLDNEVLKKFVDYTLSDDGQKIVESFDLVPIGN